MKIERCFVCDEPTGNAGRGEDSLYGDDADGPYCRECWNEKYPDVDQLLIRCAKLRSQLADETAIVNRVWKALGISTMAEANGKAIDELVADLKRRAELWERLHDARTAELKRTQEVLAAHRRFHGKVGCPGRPECYVCAEEEFNISQMEYRGTP